MAAAKTAPCWRALTGCYATRAPRTQMTTGGGMQEQQQRWLQGLWCSPGAARGGVQAPGPRASMIGICMLRPGRRSCSGPRLVLRPSAGLHGRTSRASTSCPSAEGRPVVSMAVVALEAVGGQGTGEARARTWGFLHSCRRTRSAAAARRTAAAEPTVALRGSMRSSTATNFTALGPAAAQASAAALGLAAGVAAPLRWLHRHHRRFHRTPRHHRRVPRILRRPRRCHCSPR